MEVSSEARSRPKAQQRAYVTSSVAAIPAMPRPEKQRAQENPTPPPNRATPGVETLLLPPFKLALRQTWGLPVEEVLYSGRDLLKIHLRVLGAFPALHYRQVDRRCHRPHPVPVN